MVDDMSLWFGDKSRGDFAEGFDSFRSDDDAEAIETPWRKIPEMVTGI